MGDPAPSRRGPAHPISPSRGSAGRGDAWTIRRFPELDSTNRWVLEQARAGAAPGLVAVADHQTAGRGRRGRVWAAPPGSSLLVSVLLRPTLPPDATHVLTMATALALAEAVGVVADVDARLKWPNDLVVKDRKLAGLLAEADVTAQGDVRAVVVGAGCNVEWVDFPADLADVATACNLEAGRSVDRALLLDAFLRRLAARLDTLETVAGDYGDRLDTLGRLVRVELGEGPVEGIAERVDAVGRLVVAPEHGPSVTLAVGDVVHLRAATGRDRRQPGRETP